MFWQENINEEAFTIPENIIDISFQISSKILPIDHSELLKNSLCDTLDCSLGGLAIFGIGVADGNGWEQDKNGYFYPSNRTKLTIRLKKELKESVMLLLGKTLEMGNYQVKITKFKAEKKLSKSSIIFSKMIVSSEKTEDKFLQKCFDEIKGLGIIPKKMMAGLERQITIDSKKITTRSLMIADLSKQDSVTIQENGLGEFQLFGCGIFSPQKGIESVDAV